MPLVPECSMPLALRPITMSNTILIRTELAYEVKKKSFILNEQSDSAGPARGNWLPKKEQPEKKNPTTISNCPLCWESHRKGVRL